MQVQDPEYWKVRSEGIQLGRIKGVKRMPLRVERGPWLIVDQVFLLCIEEEWT